MPLSILRQREQLLRDIRQFFAERGFVEVITPVIAPQAIPELHIDLFHFQVQHETWYLQASPELAMKQLLCQGAGSIFQIGPAFRAGDFGPQHRPEFTMLEWYRPHDDMQQGMKLLAELACVALQVERVDLLSYAEAFARAIVLDPFTATVGLLREAIRDHAPTTYEAVENEANRDELLNVLLSQCVEPTLGVTRPEIVYHFPATQSALAMTCTDEQGRPVAERFELYCRGLELANGYRELTDAAVLRERLHSVNEARVAVGREAIALPETLLELMQSPGLPPCAGVAVGFERLLMARLGVDTIDDVII